MTPSAEVPTLFEPERMKGDGMDNRQQTEIHWQFSCADGAGDVPRNWAGLRLARPANRSKKHKATQAAPREKHEAHQQDHDD